MKSPLQNGLLVHHIAKRRAVTSSHTKKGNHASFYHGMILGFGACMRGRLLLDNSSTRKFKQQVQIVIQGL